MVTIGFQTDSKLKLSGSCHAHPISDEVVVDFDQR